MVALAIAKTYTVDEYLELEKNSEIRHEYYHGKLIDLPSESKTSNRIANNILLKWDDVLEKQQYEIFIHSIKTETLNRKIFRYPDIVVTPESDNEDEYVVKQPVIMVEVASDDSWKRDAHTKKKEYTALASMQYYLIVSQEEMYVELYSRIGNDWQYAAFEDTNEVVSLPNFGLNITLSEIYDRVKFGEAKSDTNTEG